MNAAYSEQYQKVQIETASKADLLLLTYEGTVRAMIRAARACKMGHQSKARLEILNAMAGVIELMGTLNFEVGGDLATSLQSLYLYVMERLRAAVVSLDAAPLEESRHIMSSLLQTWRKALGVGNAA